MENLKEIGGFPGYCVDNTGNVFSVKTYISFAEAKKSGFLRKGICKNLDGKTKNYNGFVWKRLL